MRLYEEKLSSRNPAGRGVEEPLDLTIEPTTEDDPADDSNYMSHVDKQFSETFIRRMVRTILINERMDPDIYKIVVRSLDRKGPMTHQQLLGQVLGDFPMLSDDEIDNYIDRFESEGSIIYDPKIEKYY